MNVMKALNSVTSLTVLIASVLALGRLALPSSSDQVTPIPISDLSGILQQVASPTATETIPPNTPYATRTLKPPPTFEPPTLTPTPSQVPTGTATPTVGVEISLPGLHGAETPTPTSTPGCEPNADWTLTYTVQRDDALSAIAAKYGTYTNDLAAGNCITDPNLIQVGQVIRVPGESHPHQSPVECVPYEALTPATYATVGEMGTVTFNWRGPLATKNLLRIVRPDGTIYEDVIEYTQNVSVSIQDELSQEGTYTWYVFPLMPDGTSLTDCAFGGPWMFTRTN